MNFPNLGTQQLLLRLTVSARLYLASPPIRCGWQRSWWNRAPGPSHFHAKRPAGNGLRPGCPEPRASSWPKAGSRPALLTPRPGKGNQGRVGTSAQWDWATTQGTFPNSQLPRVFWVSSLSPSPSSHRCEASQRGLPFPRERKRADPTKCSAGLGSRGAAPPERRRSRRR